VGRRPRLPNGAARFVAVAIVAALLQAVVVVRLAYVQTIRSPSYVEVAAGNRLRIVESPAPRGDIVDINGQTLAGTRKTHVVTLNWEGLIGLDEFERAAVFGALIETLADHRYDDNLTAQELERTFGRARIQALEPVVIAEDLSPERWIAVAEQALPGIAVSLQAVRTYPNGDIAGHLLGYIGRVLDDEEATQLNRVNPDGQYRPGSDVGRAGLEKLLERHLRGIPEVKSVEVDSRNRVVRTVEVLQKGVPGATVHLTIDLRLQSAADTLLRAQLDELRSPSKVGVVAVPAPAGSLVALDPRNGAVIALASFPTFDPRDFVFGLTSAASAKLDADDHEPFLNRVVAGQYAPGSTFKPASAYAGVAAGARNVDEIWEDKGFHRLAACRSGSTAKGCLFRNAGDAVMGPLDLRSALTLSSDTYFYSLGERLWVERDRFGNRPIQQAGELFGLGEPTGIELPAEASGRLPGPDQRRRDHFDYPDYFPDPNWYTGDNVNLSIGQGDTLATPLQLANMYAAIANGGQRFQPRLIERVANGQTGETLVDFGPRLASSESLDAEALDAIIDGLGQVTTVGTARSAFLGFRHDLLSVVAKTGTAQVDGKVDNALFAGYAPAQAPRISFAVVMEESGFGGVAAAPLARAFLEETIKLEQAGPGR